MVVAVVTGANKGIGFEIVKRLVALPNYHVILTARNATLGNEAVEEVKRSGATNVEFLPLDITNTESIAAFKDVLEKRGGIDVLVNNAGIAWKGDAFDDNVVKATLGTNFYGTVAVTDALIDLILPGGRLVNITSQAGRSAILSEGLRSRFLAPDLTREQLFALAKEFEDAVHDGTYQEKGWPKSAYGISKVTENAFTRILARDNKRPILINSCCPGWCKTDMGGPRAQLSPSEGAETPVFLATLPSDGPSGFFFMNMDVAEW
eukprot:TRINITY_DN1377_c0_g1_i1.p1 TRINITY_DN1377_c0_g1~~TRINITY_DN1377_c0_g1_i1.p1  ORF type:complete len:263 (-),score=71.28 TRINITY_DN1377_c0_g1_i1:218-1006(-)